MKMALSPGASVVTPLSVAALAKAAELSSIFQPVILIGLEVTLVISNQSAATAELLLAQGATSEMMMTGAGGASGSTSLMVSVKFTLASGVVPTVLSSTFTVTA